MCSTLTEKTRNTKAGADVWPSAQLHKARAASDCSPAALSSSFAQQDPATARGPLFPDTECKREVQFFSRLQNINKTRSHNGMYLLNSEICELPVSIFWLWSSDRFLNWKYFCYALRYLNKNKSHTLIKSLNMKEVERN